MNSDHFFQAYIAAIEGDLESLTKLVPEPVAANTRLGVIWEDWTLMHVAAAEGHIAIAEYLYAHGADVNAASIERRDRGIFRPCRKGASEEEVRAHRVGQHQFKFRGGGTPLHKAAEAGRMEMTQWLLARGANLEALNYLNRIPLDYAMLYKHWDLAKHLISEGASYTPPKRPIAEQVTDFESWVDFMYALKGYHYHYSPIEPKHEPYSATLEEFLRSIWRVTSCMEDVTLTWAILADIFDKAFLAPPAEFDPAWKAFLESPWNRILGRRDDEGENDSQFEIYRRAMLRDIAQLNHSRERGDYERDDLYFGIDGWYNWYVAGYLDCGLDGIETIYGSMLKYESEPDYAEARTTHLKEFLDEWQPRFANPSWDFLAKFLHECATRE